MGEVIAVQEWDAHYAAGRGFRPVMDDEAAAFARHVGTGNGRLALDIGCGTGGFARHLHDLGYDVLGVDCAETAITQASAHCESNEGMTFQRWDAESDDWEKLANPEYDLITTRLSYAFIQGKTAFLKRVREHMTTGGTFYVMTPLVDRLPHTRRGIGITSEEVEELRHGWRTVEAYEIDSIHTCYVLTS